MMLHYKAAIRTFIHLCLLTKAIDLVNNYDAQAMCGLMDSKPRVLAALCINRVMLRMAILAASDRPPVVSRDIGI